MNKCFPRPWRIEHTDQHGLAIVAANGWPVYRWPLYITQATADTFPNDPCRQFGMDGSCITDDAIVAIVNAVNAVNDPDETDSNDPFWYGQEDCLEE